MAMLDRLSADEVERLAGQVGAQLTSSVAGDAEAAEEFVRAATLVARRLAELNARNSLRVGSARIQLVRLRGHDEVVAMQSP